MSRVAIEQLATTAITDYSSYDSTKWNVGKLIKQYTGATPLDKFIGPHKVALARPVDESTPVPANIVSTISWSPTIDWCFGIEAVVGATKRITAYSYDRTTSEYSWKGFITFSVTNATNIQRGFEMNYYTHNAGTVAVSGTAVTGTSTAFQSQRIAEGARIGFGTTDPTQVTTWYFISAIGSDTGITLTGSAGTITAGTSYVIEELRPAISLTNTTATNGGVFVAKGVTWNDFTPSGTTIAASASTIDNKKLTYWLADASVVTNTVACGLAVDNNKPAPNTGTSHMAYVLNGTASCTVYAYDLRAADTITAGKMVLTGANITITGAQAVTGAAPQTNNGVIATASHSAGSGVKSLYFVTATRVYRAALANITAGNVSWQSDNRVEAAPGGGTVTAVTGALAHIEYDSSSDYFYVSTSGATAFHHYITKYPTVSGDRFNYFWGTPFLNLDNAAADSDSVILPYDTRNAGAQISVCNGMTFYSRIGTSATGTHGILAIPFGAHWDLTAATNNVLISPSISVPNCNKLYRALVQHPQIAGGMSFQTPYMGFRVYYRTSGISDDSGSWTLIDASGDLSSVGAVSAIQFKIEFQTLGNVAGIMARIFGITLVYDDLTTDSHYQPSATNTDLVNKRFAWRFSTAFGGTVPTLRVLLYDAVTGGLLVDDNTASPTGTFEKSTDGTTFGSYNTTDKANDTTYIRYTPASLADSIRVRAVLVLN